MAVLSTLGMHGIGRLLACASRRAVYLRGTSRCVIVPPPLALLFSYSQSYTSRGTVRFAILMSARLYPNSKYIHHFHLPRYVSLNSVLSFSLSLPFCNCSFSNKHRHMRTCTVTCTHTFAHSMNVSDRTILRIHS